MTIVIKASGEREPFDQQKLIRSLQRVGAHETLINRITSEIIQSLKPQTPTREIYRKAFRLLRKYAKQSAGKYHLKRAIMKLGQSGYPFERFVGQIMLNQGFQVQNDQYAQGYCIQHEVDVIGTKPNEICFVECKYHNRPGLKCDIKVTLYVKARFDDLYKAHPESKDKKVSGVLITNTRFTQDAMNYSKCVGLKLVGWDYPEKGSLKEQIEFSALYPITCIGNFTRAEIEALLEKNIVLCETIAKRPYLLDCLHLSVRRKANLLEQIKDLVQR